MAREPDRRPSIADNWKHFLFGHPIRTLVFGIILFWIIMPNTVARIVHNTLYPAADELMAIVIIACLAVFAWRKFFGKKPVKKKKK